MTGRLSRFSGSGKALLLLLLAWPLSGLLLVTVIFFTAYVVGWLMAVVVLVLVIVSPGLAQRMFSKYPEYAPDSVLYFTAFYFGGAAFSAGLIAVFVGRPYLELVQFPSAENLPVEEAILYTSPGYRHFSDGRILPESSSTYIDAGVDTDGDSYEYHYTVAPVIPRGWRQEDPVTLWVVTGSFETSAISFADWEGPIQGLGPNGSREKYRRAVATAVADHNLQSHPEALLLRLHEESYSVLLSKFQRRLLIYLGAVVVIGWLPLFIIFPQRGEKPRVNVFHRY